MGNAKSFKDFEGTKISQLLPVIGYNDKDQYLELDDGYIGNMYKVNTLGGAPDNMQNQLEQIYKMKWPDDSFIQILFWANDDINEFRHNFAHYHGDRQTGRPNDALNAISMNILEHYEDAKVNGLAGTDCRPRNFEAYLCIKVPIKGAMGKPTKEELKSYITLRRDVDQYMSSVGLFLTNLDEWGWKRMMSKLLNRSKSASWRKGKDNHNAAYLAREQVHEVGGRVEFKEDHVLLDDQQVALLSPKEYPKIMGFGDMLNIFNDWRYGQSTMWGNFMIVLNVHYPNDKKTRRELKAKRTYMSSMNGNKLVSWIDKTRWQRKDYNIAFDKLEQKRSRLINCYLQFMIFGDDEDHLEREISKFKQIAETNAGFELERDKYLCSPLFLHSIPFGPEVESVKFLQRYNLYPSDIAAFMSPVFSSSKGNSPSKPVIPFLTRNMGLFGFNPFETNGSMNGLVVAESGSGKSVLVQYILTCVLGSGALPCSKIWNILTLSEKEQKEAIELASDIVKAKNDGGMAFIIDVGGSYRQTCEILGGSYLTFGANMKYSLNPFPSVMEWSSSEDPQSGMILEMFKVMADPTGSLDTVTSRMMAVTLQEMWDKYEKESSVTIFQQMCMQSDDQRLRDVGISLKPYAEDGMHGHLFTTKRPPPSLDNPFIVCELEELKSQPENQLIALMQIINLCYKHFFLSDQEAGFKRRKLFIVDESWEFVSSAGGSGGNNPVASFLNSAFRRFRKVDASAWIITQMLSDVYGTEVGRAIVANCVYKLFLYQKKDTIEQVKKDRLLDMSDQEFDLMKSIRTVKHKYSEIFFQGGDDIREIIRFYAPMAMLLMFSTDPKDKADIAFYTEQGYSVEDAINAVIRQRNPEELEFDTDMEDLDNDEEEDELEAA